MYIYIYIYIHTYTHVYICMYIHTHTHIYQRAVQGRPWVTSRLYHYPYHYYYYYYHYIVVCSSCALSYHYYICMFFIVAIFYPFSQFNEINSSLLSLQTQPNTAPNLFQRGVEYGKYVICYTTRRLTSSLHVIPASVKYSYSTLILS